jgi:inner membrane transporter RhtA
MGLIAAACWAAYILLNRVVGQRLPGLQGTATASAVSATVFLPLAVGLVLSGTLTGLPLLYAMTAGLMSSLVPFTLDVKALRLVPSRFFAVFMSVHPALAAFAGLVILNQVPDVHELVGIGIVIATNVIAVSTLQPSGQTLTTAPERAEL